MTGELLFDDRYRYDHIYPRGRSGEVLRAYDTHHDNRPVVIKRPAPQDAPPIRAGQEATLRNERRALLRLSGHPVLTELLDEGTFRVGGQTHLYLVMEMAEGQVVEDMVLELAASNERLPELEMLVIADAALDLLEAAHAHEIVYNDVDAKHLVWNRETYQLKIIDWGNAVFLEGDEVTPQGISRQSDVFQAGEMLSFIITGGQRLAFQGERVDLGEDAARLLTRLQRIIQRAVHPEVNQRYPDIASLRKDLAEYRRPLERDRQAVLDRVAARLESRRSQRELERLREEIAPVLARDPGHPPTRDLLRRIEGEMHRLALQSDLDAARIYLESANWTRAISLLEEVVARADESIGGTERGRALVLLEAARAFHEHGLTPAPAGFLPAMRALFENDAARAAYLLQVTPESRGGARRVQWLLAASIQEHLPGVAVLRPHLTRLRLELDALAGRYALNAALERVESALGALEAPPSDQFSAVKAIYRRVADALRDLDALLAELRDTQAGDALAGALTSARFAQEGAAALLAHLENASAGATASPDDARDALAQARALDPLNPAFDALAGRLDGLHDLIARHQTYHPQADGADLAVWFKEAAAELGAHTEDIPDPRLGRLIGALREAAPPWAAFQEAVVAGNRRGAVEALQETVIPLKKLYPNLAAWLNNVRGIVERARHVQRHALNGPFGRAMADGWIAWDRGSGIEAERLGKQALEAVADDAERAAADRLIRLGKALRTWKEGHAEGNPDLAAQLDDETLSLLTESERHHWQTFTDQMPSSTAYLKAMGPALVEHFEETSTAALRALFFHFVLRGVLEMYEKRPDDAEFWRAAAAQALPDAEQHLAYMGLTNVIRDRQTLAELVARLEAVTEPQGVTEVRKQLEASPLRLVLRPVIEGLRDLEYAFPQWEDGDFKGAGVSLGAALDRLREGEQLARIELSDFRAWVRGLHETAAELNVTRSRIAEQATEPRETPNPALPDWHQKLVERTGEALGEKHAGRFVAWGETYATMLGIYTDQEKRRSRKLRDFDEAFHAPGVNTHPAYPLYRFWRQTVEARPEFPAPPTDEPIPRYTAEPSAPVPARLRLAGLRLAGLRLTRRRLRWLLVALLAVVIGLVGLAVVIQQGGPGQIAVTFPPTPTVTTVAIGVSPTLEPEAVAATIAAIQTATAEAATDTPSPTATPSPTRTPFPTLASSGVEAQPLPLFPETEVASPSPTLTETAVEPTATATPTPTLTDTATPSPTASPMPSTPTVTPTQAAPPPPPTLSGALHGDQNVLTALEQYVQAYPWPESWFRPGNLAGGWQLGVADSPPGSAPLQVVLPDSLLAQVFGPDAAIRVRRVEVTLALREYDPTLVEAGRVFFGMGLQGSDESRVAVQVQLVRQDALNVGVRVGDEFRARQTVPVTDVRVRLALARNDDGTVDLLFNGEPLGPPRFFTAPNAPVMPFLFVQQGGVVVSVTDFIAELD